METLAQTTFGEYNSESFLFYLTPKKRKIWLWFSD